jgi:hypothetical protein
VFGAEGAGCRVRGAGCRVQDLAEAQERLHALSDSGFRGLSLSG